MTTTTQFIVELDDEQARKLVAHLRRTLGPIDKRIADQIESQIAPARPDEPIRFGSVILARRRENERRGMYVRSYAIEVDRPWTTGNHQVAWSELEDIEVLRQGLETP